MSGHGLMVSVFRSGKREEMYLYMPRDDDFDELPEALRQSFGKPLHVMDLLLRPSLRLARADVGRVMDDIREQGFYLQVPPRPELNPFRPEKDGET